MKLLDRIEQSIEQLLEGSVGRVFRNPLQPAEIGRKLERAMTANLVASVGGSIAPNDFNVTMHPDDLARIAGYSTALSRQFETWLSETATQRGYSVLDRIRVQLHDDDSVRRREIRVSATIADRQALGRDQQHGVERTEVYRFTANHSEAPALRLHVLDGEGGTKDVVLNEPVSTIGRAMDNTVVLNSHDVSRYHARVELANGQARIVDLGSTNGTSVNGAKIRSQLIHSGDEIAFGSLRVLVVPSGPARQHR